MRILVTGAKGRLGSYLSRILEQQQHTVTGIDLDSLDITDYAALTTYVESVKPAVIVHCAALTNVDYCAEHPLEAYRANGLGSQNVALAAARVGAAVCVISSNEVFDGTKTSPYWEYEPTHPVNPYGYSKWVGEQATRDLIREHYIVRTSWLFAQGGQNFPQKIIAAAKAGKPLSVVTDEVATPTYNNDLADAVAKLITTGRYGIYHLVNEGSASRYDYARFILDRIGLQDYPIAPISLDQWSRPSRPPKNAVLQNIQGASIGITLRDWRDALSAFIESEGLS